MITVSLLLFTWLLAVEMISSTSFYLFFRYATLDDDISFYELLGVRREKYFITFYWLWSSLRWKFLSFSTWRKFFNHSFLSLANVNRNEMSCNFVFIWRLSTRCLDTFNSLSSLNFTIAFLLPLPSKHVHSFDNFTLKYFTAFWSAKETEKNFKN